MADTTPQAPIPDSINGRYRVLRLLGQGGVGRVYLVEDGARDGRRMALKTLLPAAAGHALASGFRDEFAELAKLEHPHLARAYDFGRIQRTSEYFFTTEFIDGIPLSRATVDASSEEILDIAVQLLLALEFIHSHGILHNDLKPANILLETPERPTPPAGSAPSGKVDAILGARGTAKLIDFGLISRESLAWDAIYGTPAFLSPERILKIRADRRSDLYTLGIVLFHAFTRRLPFASEDLQELLGKHLREPAPSLRKLRPDAPEVADRLVARLLRKRPEDRFRDASEALSLIRDSRTSIDAGPEPPLAPRGERLSAGSLLYRGLERSRLCELVDLAVSGKPGAVVVDGPRGIGKSRLVSELRPRVQVAGGTFVEASGLAVEGNLQGLIDAWVSALRNSGAAADAVQRRLRVAADADVDPAEVLGRDILESASSSLTLFHVDDFERASRTVRRFVTDLLLSAQEDRGGGVPCRLLVIVSTDPAGRRDDFPGDDPPRIRLREFTAEESTGFLGSVFGQPPPAPIAESMFRVSGGNPLFLLELARDLVERGAARFSGTGWTFRAETGEEALPGSLEHLFRGKMRGLGGRLLDILGWLAVSRTPVSRAVLALCTRLQPGILQSSIDSLAARGLILRRRSPEGEERFWLAYSGARDDLLDRLGPDAVRQLHQRFAQNLEAGTRDWDGISDELAEHWLAAGNEGGFLRFAPRAADLLRDRGDLETAVLYRKKLAEGIPPTAVGRKTQSLAKLAEMHEFLWDLDACIDDLEQIQTLAGNLLKPVDRALLLRRIACVELGRSRYALARDLLDRALDSLPDGLPVHRASIVTPRALARWLSGDPGGAREDLAAARSGVLGDEPPAEEKERLLWVASRSHVAAVEHLAGRLESEARLLAGNLEALGDAGPKQARGATECQLGGVLLDLGRHEEAATRLQDALRTAKDIGDRKTLCRARERVAELHLRFGRIPAALRLALAGRQDAEGLDNPTALASVLRTLGRIYAQVDEPDEARRAVSAAIESSRRDTDPLTRGLVRVEAARLCLEAGDPKAAREHLEVCSREGAAIESPLLAGCHAMWTFVADWREASRRSPELLAKARDLIVSNGYRGETIDLLLLECEVEIEARGFDRAWTLLAELKQLTREHKDPDLRAEAAYLIGRWHRDQGRDAEAAAWLSRARAAALEKKKLRLVRLCAGSGASVAAPSESLGARVTESSR